MHSDLLFSIALAVFQQFELIWVNYLNMELQMENVAGKLFHSQTFSLAPLVSGCTTCFPCLLSSKASDLGAVLLPAVMQAPRRSPWPSKPEGSTPRRASTRAPPLCSLPCADTQVTDTVPQGTGDPTPSPIREPTLLQFHYGGTAVTPKLKFHWVSIISLSWPFPDSVFQKALIYKTSHQQGNW